jgi:hypothetical protein
MLSSSLLDSRVHGVSRLVYFLLHLHYVTNYDKISRLQEGLPKLYVRRIVVVLRLSQDRVGPSCQVSIVAGNMLQCLYSSSIT